MIGLVYIRLEYAAQIGEANTSLAKMSGLISLSSKHGLGGSAQEQNGLVA